MNELEERERRLKGYRNKELRAHGGCLGAQRRRRTWQAAKSYREPQAGVDL